jgi:hypothetical protein
VEFSFIGGGNQNLEKTTDLPQVTDKLDHMFWEYFDLSASYEKKVYTVMVNNSTNINKST